MEAETKYAKSGDVHIAYRVVGSGPRDVILVPGTVSHVELYWQLPALVKPTVEVLAGVPTVVYGYFGLLFVTPYVLTPLFRSLGYTVEVYNAAAGGIVVGIMTIPTVASLGEDVLRAVPRGLREAAYALGATKFECGRVKGRWRLSLCRGLGCRDRTTTRSRCRHVRRST